MEISAFSTLKPLETLQEEIKKLGLVVIKEHNVESIGRQFRRLILAQGENKAVLWQMLTPKRTAHKDPLVVVSGSEEFVKVIEGMK